MRTSLIRMASAGACAAALGWCGAAAAQSVVSGGAWLPLPLYREAIDAAATPAMLPYVGAGSTLGLRAFLTNDATPFERVGPVHWVGSDAVLTQGQVDHYLTLGPGRLGDPAGHGPLIQMPAAYVPVTLSYKGPAGPVTLTRTQLCAVLSGLIDRWSQLGVTVAPALDAFKVVVRADGSGTTELLTRHLGAACGGQPYAAFHGQAVFADAFKPGPLPPHFVAAQGEGGVVMAMAGQVSALAYMGPDAVFTEGLKQAWLVNPHDGVAYLPTAANVVAAMESYGYPGLPTGATVARRPGDATWSRPDNPGNPLNWVRVLADPLQGYPIVGSTNFVLSQCYADPAAAAAIRLFLKRHYDDTARVADHQLVPLPAMVRARLLATFVNPAGAGGGLTIGHGAVCGDIAGRG